MKALEPYLVSVLTSFLKRNLDPFYDESAVVRKMRSWSLRERAAAEAALYSLAAVIEVRMGEHTAAREVLKSLFIDGASEIGSRIMNHPFEKPNTSRTVVPSSPRSNWFERATKHLEEPLF